MQTILEILHACSQLSCHPPYFLSIGPPMVIGPITQSQAASLSLWTPRRDEETDKPSFLPSLPDGDLDKSSLEETPIYIHFG